MRRPLGRASLTLSVASMLLLGAASPAVDAGADLGPVATLSEPGADAEEPQVAVAPNGDAIFTWVRWRLGVPESPLLAQTRSAAEVWGDVETISAAPASGPRVAMDAAGNAVFVFRSEDGHIQARTRSVAGVLSAVLDVADGYVTEPSVAVSPEGRAVFVWTRVTATDPFWTQRIETRTLSAAGVLRGIRILSGPGFAREPHVGVDERGNAVVMWRRDTGTVYNLLEARSRSWAGELSPVQRIGHAAGGPVSSLAVTPDGKAVFAWAFGDTVRTRARAADGALSAVDTLSWSAAHSLALAVDAAGNAVFAWQQPEWRFPARLRAAARSTAGDLSGQRVLAGGDAAAPRVAMDPNGDAVIVWLLHDGLNWRVQTRTRSAAGALGTIKTLSWAGQDAEAPQVAVDAGGNAFVTWRRFDGANWRVQARVLPAM